MTDRMEIVDEGHDAELERRRAYKADYLARQTWVRERMRCQAQIRAALWREAVEDVPLWRLLVALPLIVVFLAGMLLFGCRPDDGRHG